MGFYNLPKFKRYAMLARASFHLALLCATSTAIAAGVDQDRYDESVGFAYGYALSPVRMGQRCQQLFPEYATEIQVALDKWRTRNESALIEIERQWKAYVERDHVAAKLPPQRYSDEIELRARSVVADGFRTLGGEDSSFSKEHCRSYAVVTMRSVKLYLEAKLMSELDSFRQCRSTGLCPNLPPQE